MRVEHLPDWQTEIKNDAYNKYKSLEYIRLPSNLIKIGECAFNKCYGLISITIPRSCTTICNYGFDSCINMRSYKFEQPSSLNYLGDSVFAGNEQLYQISLPDGITNLGWGSFSRCYNLCELRIPKGVTTIARDFCHRCSRLKRVYLSPQTTAIYRHAFMHCTNLYDIQVPTETFQVLAERVFYDCTSLPCMYLPSKVTIEGEGDPFSGCSTFILLCDDDMSLLDNYTPTVPYLTLSTIKSMVEKLYDTPAEEYVNLHLLLAEHSEEMAIRARRRDMNLIHYLCYYPKNTATLMEQLVHKFPIDACLKDAYGRVPLEIIATRNERDLGAMKVLADLYPTSIIWDALHSIHPIGMTCQSILDSVILCKLDVLEMQHEETNLYPFQLAATSNLGCCDLNVVFGLLCLKPEVLSENW